MSLQSMYTTCTRTIIFPPKMSYSKSSKRERRRKQTKVWRGPVEVGKAGALERERERERGGGVVSFIYSGTVLWGVLEACVGKVGLFVE